MTTACEILSAAQALIAGDRRVQNGDAITMHTNIAALWSAYLGVQITASQVALMMVLFKVARTKAGNANMDNYVDAAGYAALAAEVT